MKNILRIILIVTALMNAAGGRAQIKSIGVPAIQNFSRSVYRASTQNWAVAQDNRGFMYFANNDGLLEYDGTSWNLYQFAEPALTRSLTVDKNGVIYVGMFNEFGAVKPDASGKLYYTSFRHSLPDSLVDISDVWRIHATGDGVFFQTYSYIFYFDADGRLLRTFSSPGNFRFSFFLKEKLYIQEMGRGLLELKNGELVPLPGFETLRENEIWALLPGKRGNLMVGTAEAGVFSYEDGVLIPWNNEANDFLKANQIFSASAPQANYYVFGTIQDGLLITDLEGKILQHLSKRNGLQNNTVLSLASDRSGNLWLGLDNGIDYVEVNSAFTFLFQPEGLGAGYTAAIFNGNLYVGTNNGLFVKSWTNERDKQNAYFKLIPSTVGQVWYLGVHEGVLLCGHDNGTFQVEGEKVKKISDEKGAWKYIGLTGKPGLLIGGTYQGFTLFEKEEKSKSWRFVKKIAGFSESSRVLEEDAEGYLWMTHGFKGAYRITFNSTLDSVVKVNYYDKTAGFSTNNYINVYKIDHQLVFTAREGIYRFNPHNNRFERDEKLQKLFGIAGHINYLRQDKDRNIWFVAENKPGVLRFREDGTYSQITSPFEIIQNQMLGGFEFIYPYSDNDVFFALESGFAHYSPQASRPFEIPFRAFIRKVEIPYCDTTLFCGDHFPGQLSAKKTVPEFPYRKNAFRMSFSAPRFHGKRGSEYSYKLDKYTEGWSPWSPATSCEFTNLHEGVYVFTVKARDVFGNESNEDYFTFRILPPWYRSRGAYAGYILLMVMLVLFFVWFILKRIEVSQRRERLKHLREYRTREQVYQREALIAEKQIVNLRNETLHAQMIHRNKELANQTLHLIQKNKFLTKIKEELRKVSTQTKDETVKIKFSQLLRRIDKEIDNENQWRVFESAFDEVHEDFLKRLKDRFPELTPKEMRLCAYLRMNISSKEIATLMNISIRGVEISRYRLRKKLNIDRDMNLTKFILEL